MRDDPHGDVFNNPINVGDFVLYAATLDRSPILKVGFVLELRSNAGGHPERVVHKISVRTAERTAYVRVGEKYQWELQKNGSPVTLEFSNRLVRVSSRSIPAAVRKLLKIGH